MKYLADNRPIQKELQSECCCANEKIGTAIYSPFPLPNIRSTHAGPPLRIVFVLRKFRRRNLAAPQSSYTPRPERASSREAWQARRTVSPTKFRAPMPQPLARHHSSFHRLARIAIPSAIH